MFIKLYLELNLSQDFKEITDPNPSMIDIN